jgi:hypothetical protein
MRITVELDVRWPTAFGSRRRRVAATALLAIALVVPGVALASHQFTDVPTDHTFHQDISKLKGAAITAGCSPTMYCPDATVTRGQMAAFLNRGLGRVVRTNLLGTANSATAVSTGSLTITAGNFEGGFAYVLVTSSVNAYVTGPTCPCEATIVVTRGGAQVSSEIYMDLPPVAAPDLDSDDAATTTNVIVVPTGVPQTFTATFQRKLGTAAVYMYGTLTAVVIPFGGTGEPPVLTAPAAAEIVGKPGD